MPLVKTIQPNTFTKILVWKIEESFEDLYQSVVLNDNSLTRLNSMKSELHKRGFLSVRYLLKEAGYTDFDLYYNEHGKPLLKDHTHISITHSYHYSAIILSQVNVGIDIEKNREKIINIYDKFVNTEKDSLSDEDLVKQLTVIWGAKESMYKIYPHGGLSFKNHIAIDPFLFHHKQSTGRVVCEDWNKEYQIFFEFLQDGFTLVYAMPKV